MSNIIYLSYFINEQTPLYGGEKAIFIEKRSEISKGASSNTKYLKFPNHTGTHIDFPNHFSNIGKTFNDYPASFWKFKKVFVLTYLAKEEEILDNRIIKETTVPNNTELLIIKTGFGKYRDKKIYWNNNPGLSPQLVRVLKKRCPDLKAVGLDFISVSSYRNRKLGREVHRAFLVENNILLIEDMNLDDLKDNRINTVTVLPLMIDKADGVPVTIIAELGRSHEGTKTQRNTKKIIVNPSA